MDHGVQKVILELDMGDASSATMDTFRRFFEQEIQPELALLLDRIALPGQDLHIGCMEVDLGTINLASPVDGWRRKLEKVVASAQTRELPATGASAIPEAAADRVTEDRRSQASQLGTLLDFMIHGITPWHERRPFRDVELAFQQASATLPQTLPSAQVKLIERILDNPNSRARLLNLLPLTQTRIIGMYIESRMSEFGPSSKALAGTSAATDALMRLCLETVGHSTRDRYLYILAKAGFWSEIKTTPRSFTEAPQVGIRKLLDNFQVRGDIYFTDTSHPDGHQSSHAEDRHGHEAGSSPDTIYVENAGVVLVASYLPMLFSNVGLINASREFPNTVAVGQGAHLVHFLATGELAPHESELALPKVLCGMEVTDALSSDIELTKDVMTEGEELLNAVIKHWEKIGNTSIAALRQTYLQREGKLECQQSRWHLTVEQRGVDILLSTLPWALGTLYLPWLDQPLQVDWA